MHMDAQSCLKKQTHSRLGTTELEDEDTEVHDYLYNGFNQLVEEGIRGNTNKYEYDERGNLIKVTDGGYVTE